ncbi:MAG: hypothetical protein HYT98_04420 [Candidatus Sungbacteria bacterium]|nr:hypothetical protein [Candidatus Sungbacteria bacterium]
MRREGAPPSNQNNTDAPIEKSAVSGSGQKPQDILDLEKQIAESRDKITGGLRGEELKAESERLVALVRAKKEKESSGVPAKENIQSSAEIGEKDKGQTPASKKTRKKKKATADAETVESEKTPKVPANELVENAAQETASKVKIKLGENDLAKKEVEKRQEQFAENLKEFLRKNPRERDKAEVYEGLAKSFNYDAEKILAATDAFDETGGVMAKRRKGAYKDVFTMLGGTSKDKNAGVEKSAKDKISADEKEQQPADLAEAVKIDPEKLEKEIAELKQKIISGKYAGEELKTLSQDLKKLVKMRPAASKRIAGKKAGKDTEDADGKFKISMGAGKSKSPLPKDVKTTPGPGEQTPTPADTDTGKIESIRTGILEKYAEGKKAELTARKKELEKKDARNAAENAEYEELIRAERLEHVIKSLAIIEIGGKPTPEFMQQFSRDLMKAEKETLEWYELRGKNETHPPAEFFSALIDRLPQERYPKLHELKEKSGKKFKDVVEKLTDALHEPDDEKFEGKFADLEGSQPVLKELLGEEGLKQLFKTLRGMEHLRVERESGVLTPEQAEQRREELNQAQGQLGSAMEKAWSIAGLVGIMLLLGLIFMIIVELEAIDFMLKKTKGGKGGIF